MFPSDNQIALDLISLVIAGISLCVSGYVAYRTSRRDRPNLKIQATTGMLSCKYFSDTKRVHYVAIARLVNSGFIPITITEIGIFAASGKWWRSNKSLHNSPNCLLTEEGSLFQVTTLDPGEILTAWMNPKRVEGYEILMNSEFPDNKINIGFYARTFDNQLSVSYFGKESLAGCRNIILPDESEEQPRTFIRMFPPLPEDLIELDHSAEKTRSDPD